VGVAPGESDNRHAANEDEQKYDSHEHISAIKNAATVTTKTAPTLIALILSPLLQRHQSRLMSFNETLRSNIGLPPVKLDHLKLGLQAIAQHLGCASRSGRSSIDFGEGAADAPGLRVDVNDQAQVWW
jgi:hypothetical protein